MDTPVDLYLDLLKRSLTNTIFQNEPDIDDDEFRFTMQCATHYVNSDAVSMIALARFDNIRNCIENILRNGVPGDLIEAGVWRGGASIFMRAMLKAYGVTDRIVWAADSFEGLPVPDPSQFPLPAKRVAPTPRWNRGLAVTRRMMLDWHPNAEQKCKRSALSSRASRTNFAAERMPSELLKLRVSLRLASSVPSRARILKSSNTTVTRTA